MSNQQNEYIYDDIQLKKRTLTKEEVFRSRRRRERWANQTNRYNTDAGENDEYKDDSLLNLVMGVQQYLKERAQHDSPLRSLQHKLFAYTIKQSARLDQICGKQNEEEKT
ncbi:hypothetical protein G6F62_008564 [Rhizopus arrhizus]|nr:hypothetical protein G6F23_007232 [Rhizopus arrhizus]KAG0955480.1 hypothetical protein G6F32_002729 [Rhizopus arrhizus]KAG1285528.1 hypothetical protein G6F66_010388 [Rhizopus arrhizus]KAG1325414.1 hypothetical protein G6F62_008564 [Rhizopus arrhizus]KAG1394722.1 hypothetical protein G6F60_010681 [Rhizopus arrhizus]